MKQSIDSITQQQEQNSLNFLSAWKQHCQDMMLSAPNASHNNNDGETTIQQLKQSQAEKLPVVFSDAPLKPGQIRLLSKTDKMLEVLLLKKQEENWTVIPLSPFAYPASELEITLHDDIVNRTPMPFERTSRTYCLWSFFEYPEILLEQRSWLMGEVSCNEMKNIQEALLHFYTGAPLSNENQARIGTPILLPFDERLDYETHLKQTVEQAISNAHRCLFSIKTLNAIFQYHKKQTFVSAYAAADEQTHQTPVIHNGDINDFLSFIGPGTEDIVFENGASIQKLAWSLPTPIPSYLNDASIYLLDYKHEITLGNCEIKNGDTKRPKLVFTPSEGQTAEQTICVKELCLYVED